MCALVECERIFASNRVRKLDGSKVEYGTSID